MFKKATVGLLSIALIFAYAIPSSAQVTEEELEAQFEAEIYAYGQTHSLEETAAYVQYRIEQMTNENLQPEEQEFLAAAGISSDVLYDDKYADALDMFINGPREIEEAVMRCTRDSWNTCRSTYNSSLFTSAGLAIGVFAGCNGITALAGFAACTGGALGMHGMNIAAAQTTLNNCMNSSYGNCSRQIRGY